jgi:hypothetical protein
MSVYGKIKASAAILLGLYLLFQAVYAFFVGGTSGTGMIEARDSPMVQLGWVTIISGGLIGLLSLYIGYRLVKWGVRNF